MKLFLYSHFSGAGHLIKEDIENKIIPLITSASIHKRYTGYVGSGRRLFKTTGAIPKEIDISMKESAAIKSFFKIWM